MRALSHQRIRLFRTNNFFITHYLQRVTGLEQHALSTLFLFFERQRVYRKIKFIFVFIINLDYSSKIYV